MSSLARLRTRKGCLQCRKRRKKCDETRPHCIACTRNSLDCEWPSVNNQLLDGRTRIMRAVSASSLSAIQLPPPMVTPAPFQSDKCAYLYRYFVSTILPRLVRQRSLDQTHMLRLGLQFSPLFGAMISVAGMQLPCTERWPTQFALQGYLYTIQALQKSLTDVTKSGCDDRILATVVLLTVFESCRSDTTPTVTPHITATGLLLAQRRPREFRTKSAATFDRICVESFLYHASLMMLFDPSLDALTEHRNELGLSLYFDKLRSPTNQLQVEETTLQASYKFYLLIADVTKLSRLSRPLDSAEFIRWQSLEHELLRWSHFKSCSTDISLELCYLAIQILFHKINPNVTSAERSRRMRLFLNEGLQRVPALNVDSYPAGYMLWPAAILGVVAESFEERAIIRNFLASISDRKGGGQGAWVQKRMERIWRADSRSISQEPSLYRLQLLLDQG